MDLSYYLSEILEQQGEVSIPGLGYFTKVRVNGYYNDEEEKFYPPCNEVQFDPKPVNGDDETLANYIADKKDISPTSAKFFISQYVTALLQDAAIKDVPIGELGWFSFEKSKLAFKSKINDPAYFGLPTLQVHKIGKQPVAADPIPELSLTIASEHEHLPEPVETEQDGFFDSTQGAGEEEQEEYEERRGLNIKLIAMIAGGILVVATAGLYLYNPSVFGVTEKRKPLVSTSPVSQTPVTPDTVVNTAVPATDTASQAAPVNQDTASLNTATQATPQQDLALDAPVQKTVNDEALKAATAQNTDELPWHPTYAIVAAAFDTQEKAENAVDEFKARGLPASVLVQGKSKKRLVVIGTYQTNKEATSSLKELKRARKVKKEVYIKELK